MNLRELLSSISIDPIDAVALASVAVVAVGAAMVYVPAAFIVVGALGLAYAVAASRGGEA